MSAPIALTEAAKAVIQAGALAHLATLNSDGTPHVTCAWAGLDGDQILIATLFDQRKLANMRRDPRVTISFAAPDSNAVGMQHYLVVSGVARITEGGAPELLQELARTYVGPDAVFPPMPEPPQGFVTTITPTKVSGVGPWVSD